MADHALGVRTNKPMAIIGFMHQICAYKTVLLMSVWAPIAAAGQWIDPLKSDMDFSLGYDPGPNAVTRVALITQCRCGVC